MSGHLILDSSDDRDYKPPLCVCACVRVCVVGVSGCRGVGMSGCRGVGVSGSRGVGVSGCRGVGASGCTEGQSREA